MGIHCCSSMLGSAVSSSTPNDFQPNSHKGLFADPLISFHAMPPPPGMAYAAVGMQRALDSAIGLPSRSTSAPWMLVLLMPAEVRRSLMMTLAVKSLFEHSVEMGNHMFGITRLRKTFQIPSVCFCQTARYRSLMLFPFGKWAMASPH